MDVTTPAQRSEWTSLTNRLSADHAGHDVIIEVLDPEGGDNPLVERLPFDSITYDPKVDVVVVSVGGGSPRYPVVLRHLIHHPREILFDLIHGGAALKITDAGGTTTLVSLLRRHPAEGTPGS
ncbi:MAG: DUF5335 family protein [Blastococcus sp.]